MGCDDIDSSQDRLHSGDAAQVGPTGQGRRAGLTTDERQRLKELERENRELTD